MSIDLHDTARCDRGERCEACGKRRPDRQLLTANTMFGVVCVTLCPDCHADHSTPPLDMAACVNRMILHCSHLGVTPVEMGLILTALDDASGPGSLDEQQGGSAVVASTDRPAAASKKAGPAQGNGAGPAFE